MKNLRLFNKNNNTESFENICIYQSTVVDLLDSAEDSKTAQEFERNISLLKLGVNFKVDRITPDYVRLKGFDAFGNLQYLRAEF